MNKTIRHQTCGSKKTSCLFGQTLEINNQTFQSWFCNKCQQPFPSRKPLLADYVNAVINHVPPTTGKSIPELIQAHQVGILERLLELEKAFARIVNAQRLR